MSVFIVLGRGPTNGRMELTLECKCLLAEQTFLHGCCTETKTQGHDTLEGDVSTRNLYDANVLRCN